MIRENTKMGGSTQSSSRLISVLLSLLLAACLIASWAASIEALPPNLYVLIAFYEACCLITR